MSQTERPTAAFVLSLIAGIFILINGALTVFAAYFIAELDILGLIARDDPTALQTIPEPVVSLLGSLSTIIYIFTIVGIVFGALVLLGAIMIYRNPAKKTTWGVIILVFSILSIVIGGGFLIGFILGIIGGALALAWKPTAPTTASTTTAATTK
jgi:hypothetical protein